MLPFCVNSTLLPNSLPQPHVSLSFLPSAQNSPRCSPFVFKGFRTLSFSVACKSFACHSYENCRVYTNNSHFGSPGAPRGTQSSSLTAFFVRSFHSLHKERFTILLESSGSTLFLKIAGVSPNNFHSGNCWQDAPPKAHFFRPLFSTAYTLFQVPYPVTPFLATLTKTAGCIPTIPVLGFNPSPLQSLRFHQGEK